MVIASFIFFLLIFVAIGMLSALKSEGSAEDYLTAGKSVPAWLAGLSAVATNNSGFMFIGMIGLTYSTGLSSIWLMLGWIAGDLAASLSIMRRLREVSASPGIHSFGALLARWHDTDFRWLQRLAGVLTILFLGAYSAAQLKAGSKALHVLFGWDASTGALIGAVMVILYCFAGGIRASIWTDAAQSFVMLAAMLVMVFAGLLQLDGFGGVYPALLQVSPTYMNWFPETDGWGQGLFVLGWVFAGFGVAGQPHIVIRFVSLDHPQSIGRMRLYYYSWFVMFYSLTIVAGMLARLLLPESAAFDAELALPTLAMEMLSPVLIGLFLAGLFAATMSTVDSLIIACTAAFTRDFHGARTPGIFITKLVTLSVVAVALGFALSDSRSVLSLVLIAWGLLASAFAPLLLVYAFEGKPDEKLAISMLLVGVAVFLLWRHFGLSQLANGIMPAMLSGMAMYAIGKIMGWTLENTGGEERAGIL
jgi:sodium/proline symporter